MQYHNNIHFKALYTVTLEKALCQVQGGSAICCDCLEVRVGRQDNRHTVEMQNEKRGKYIVGSTHQLAV